MPTNGPDASDELTFTLSEGITLAVAELAPYGATLTETGSKDGSDAGTLTESGSSTTLTVSSDTASLDDTGAVQPTMQWATDDATLTDIGTAFTPNPSDTDTGTLAEGITLTAATPSPYGGTLTEVEGFVWTGTDTGTLDDSDAYFGNPQTGTDAITLSETGAVTESNAPSDASELNDDVTTLVVDDLVAEGTVTDTTASLTAAVIGAETGTLAENTSLQASGGFLADDDDAMTLAEAVVLTVPAVTSEDGTLAEGSALLLTPTETATLSEAAAPIILATGTDTGTLGDTGGATINFPGGAIVVYLTSTDSATLSDTGIALGAFNGKALGTVAIAVRANAVARLRRRATTTDAELEPLAVGAGDL